MLSRESPYQLTPFMSCRICIVLIRRSNTDCSVIKGIAGSTGRTPPPVYIASSGKTSAVPSGPSQTNTTIQFVVDVTGVISFVPSLFVDRLRPLLSLPVSYVPYVYVQSSGENLKSVFMSLSNQGRRAFVVKSAVTALLDSAYTSKGMTSEICKTGARRVVVPAGEWGKAVDFTIDCADHSMPFATSTTLIAVCVGYYVTGIIMALLFSLPKYKFLQKSLYLSYFLWLFFGFLGAHRFYLRRSHTAILYLCTAGLFGLGWLADGFLTYSNYNATNYDEDLEVDDVPMRRVRNAPRPEFVSRREALRRISQRQLEGSDPTQGHVA